MAMAKEGALVDHLRAAELEAKPFSALWPNGGSVG